MRISGCVITKNEEKNILTCLESMKPAVSEIIVVDTGSTDRTAAIASAFGAKVYHYQWDDNFSNARNFAILKAKGDWIIFLDADEYLTKKTVEELPALLELCRKKKVDLIYGLLTNYNRERDAIITSVPVIRIFRNDLNIRYRGAIHEFVTRFDREPVKLDATEKVQIIHTGYSDEDLKDKKKAERNLKLLFEELEKRPEDSNLCFYISESYNIAGEHEKALEFARKVVEYHNGNLLGIYEKNYLNMIHIMVHLQYPKHEILKVTKEAISECPNYPDFYSLLGRFYCQDNRFHDAIEAFETGIKKLGNARITQSRALFELKEMFGDLGRAYYKVNEMAKSTQAYVESLKTGKYYYASLKGLLHMLSQYEPAQSIAGFFGKLYDYGNIKDILFLLKASLQTGNKELGEFFMNKVNVGQQTSLKKEHAILKLLKGEYEEASLILKELCLESDDDSCARLLILSAMLQSDLKLLEEMSCKMKPSLARFAKRLCGGCGELLQEDRADILLLFKECIELKKLDLLLDMVGKIQEFNIYYELAEMLYGYEQYGLAVKCYDRYLEAEGDLPLKMLNDILIKMGDCLYRSGHPELAVDFFKDAQKNDPHDYRVYELAIMAYESLGDIEGLRSVLQAAETYYPESYYIQSKQMIYKTENNQQ